MNWLTLAEVVRQSGVQERTVIRRINLLQKREPELYNALVKKENQKRLYHPVRFLAYIKLPTHKVNPKNRKKKGNITRIKKLSIANHKPRKRTPTKKAEEAIEDIWGEPFGITMDEATKALYDNLKSEAERVRFEVAVRILDHYVHTPLNLDQCCRQEGGSRQAFVRWIKHIESIGVIYERAKISRTLEQHDVEVEEAEFAIRMGMNGYNVTLPTQMCEVQYDSQGREIVIEHQRRIQEKHVSRNMSAAMFVLTNKKGDVYKRNPGFGGGSDPLPGTGRYMDPLQMEMQEKSYEELAEMYADGQRRLSESND